MKTSFEFVASQMVGKLILSKPMTKKFFNSDKFHHSDEEMEVTSSLTQMVSNKEITPECIDYHLDEKRQILYAIAAKTDDKIITVMDNDKEVYAIIKRHPKAVVMLE